jgi:hypothetical protein
VGLDMYAYAAAQANADWGTGEQIEIAYWRKHPNLHGWMEQLWEAKGRPGVIDTSYQDVMFNGVEVELTWDDLDQLEEDITNGRLPHTTGFFFGSNSDDYYQSQDLEFVRKARAELFTGLKVFYNSSW